MGLYINPTDMSKEEWLLKHGTYVPGCAAAWAIYDQDPNLVPVCLVDNIMFRAAGVVFDRREFEAFASPVDGRKKEWYCVPKEKIKEVCPDYRYYFKE